MQGIVSLRMMRGPRVWLGPPVSAGAAPSRIQRSAHSHLAGGVWACCIVANATGHNHPATHLRIPVSIANGNQVIKTREASPALVLPRRYEDGLAAKSTGSPWTSQSTGRPWTSRWTSISLRRPTDFAMDFAAAGKSHMDFAGGGRWEDLGLGRGLGSQRQKPEGWGV